MHIVSLALTEPHYRQLTFIKNVALRDNLNVATYAFEGPQDWEIDGQFSQDL